MKNSSLYKWHKECALSSVEIKSWLGILRAIWEALFIKTKGANIIFKAGWVLACVSPGCVMGSLWWKEEEKGCSSHAEKVVLDVDFEIFQIFIWDVREVGSEVEKNILIRRSSTSKNMDPEGLEQCLGNNEQSFWKADLKYQWWYFPPGSQEGWNPAPRPPLPENEHLIRHQLQHWSLICYVVSSAWARWCKWPKPQVLWLLSWYKAQIQGQGQKPHPTSAIKPGQWTKRGKCNHGRAQKRENCKGFALIPVTKLKSVN